jgi:hypothetical protein
MTVYDLGRIAEKQSIGAYVLTIEALQPIYYSVTSPARSNADGEIARPSVLAVLTLTSR